MNTITSINAETISSFPICIHINFLNCLVALPGPSNTILKRYGKSGKPCLFPDFSKIFEGFLHFYVFLLACFMLPLLCLCTYIVSLISQKYLPWRGDATWHRTFVHLSRWSWGFLFIHLIMWWIALLDFIILNHHCIF